MVGMFIMGYLDSSWRSVVLVTFLVPIDITQVYLG